MPFSNRSRRTSVRSTGTPREIHEVRAHGVNRAQAAVVSFLLATVAGTTVSQARQQSSEKQPTSEKSEAAATSTDSSATAEGHKPSNTATLTVQLTADGSTRPVQVPIGSTVGALLKQENIALDDLDRCSDPLKAQVKNGGHIWVARISKKLTVQHTPIPFGTRKKYTSDIPVGNTTVFTPGKNGERVTSYRDIFKDGKRTERVMVSEKITPAQTQVEMVGVRGMTLASRGYFSGKRLVEMVATGYGPGENGQWGAHTASGLRPGRGVVAVDPRFIPLGTRLYVEGYGYCVAGDTGSAIKGNRIDLGMDSRSEASEVGRKRVRVLILD